MAPVQYYPESPGIVPSGSKIKHAGRRKEAQLESPTATSVEQSTKEGLAPNAHYPDERDGPTLGIELEGERVSQGVPHKTTQTHGQLNATNLTGLVTEINALDAVRKGYEKDSQVGKIFSDINEFPNYGLNNGLLYMHEHGRTYLCVLDTNIGEYNLQTLLVSHAHSLLAHLGNHKTYAYTLLHMWWQNLAKDMESFCMLCMRCASSKTSTQRPYGLLEPLPVPQHLWSQIGVGFMGPLPQSQTLLGQFDMICVVIDQLTLMVHMVPTRQDYTAMDIAKVVYTNIY